jgi:hypothetical protein
MPNPLTAALGKGTEVATRRIRGKSQACGFHDCRFVSTWASFSRIQTVISYLVHRSRSSVYNVATLAGRQKP